MIEGIEFLMMFSSCMKYFKLQQLFFQHVKSKSLILIFKENQLRVVQILKNTNAQVKFDSIYHNLDLLVVFDILLNQIQ